MLYTPVLRSTILRSVRATPRSIAALPRPQSFARRPVLVTPTLLLQRRSVASSVSGKPASQTFKHAGLNIKEEAGNSAADLAKMIASANLMEDDLSKGSSTFVRDQS